MKLNKIFRGIDSKYTMMHLRRYDVTNYVKWRHNDVKNTIFSEIRLVSHKTHHFDIIAS